ncbi:MAG: DUF1905 domain-containing protein [Bacteroidetes bacterium]|nr:MAG: DUF1905 domain-containing protein [Bacteroidota bacterium]
MSKWTFTAPLERFASDLWHFHVKVPPDIVKALVCGSDRRVIATFNGRERVHCALMPAGDRGWFLNLNKELRKKLGLALGDSVHVELEKDDSPYGMPVPDELAELLRQDEEGNRYFHSLTPGKQRSLIHIVGKYKRSETRLHKAIVIIEFLKANGGRLDFKALMQAFKES